MSLSRPICHHSTNVFMVHHLPPKMFVVLSTGIIYAYYALVLKVDEEDFGGHEALLQEGLFASISLFLVFFTRYRFTWCYNLLCAEANIDVNVLICIDNKNLSSIRIY
ncbi:hypothetical protein ACJIZ3_019896 [Penstemon smallii]|uniref:Uncharacterized protein n=1 Tax=Penstemon smallii TaxID=265156 RepID=A0ABD3T2H0_9LAMI